VVSKETVVSTGTKPAGRAKILKIKVEETLKVIQSDYL